MLEILLLTAVTSGIVAFARGRGGKPWLWGIVTGAGYYVIIYFGSFFAVLLGANPVRIQENKILWFFGTAIIWTGIVAFCARFLLGRAYAKPDGMWVCKNCSYLNKRYAVICEACRQPYASKAVPSS